MNNPDPNPVERETISNSIQIKKFKYPAGLDSKFRILHTTGIFHQNIFTKARIHQKSAAE